MDNDLDLLFALSEPQKIAAASLFIFVFVLIVAMNVWYRREHPEMSQAEREEQDRDMGLW